MNELWFCSSNCQMLITKPNTHYYIVSVLQVSSVKKFIKNVTPHVVNLFFYLSFTASFSINLNVNRNYIHTFPWKSLLKRHFFPSYELHILLTRDRCALTLLSMLDWISGVTGLISYIHHPGVSIALHTSTSGLSVSMSKKIQFQCMYHFWAAYSNFVIKD